MDVLQVVQQRSAQAEVEDSRRQIQELSQIRKQLQRELADVKDRLEAELAAKNEEASMSLPLSLSHSAPK
jgi:myosin protein heavy chain